MARAVARAECEAASPRDCYEATKGPGMISRQLTIFCDTCEHWVYVDGRTEAKARRSAKAAGWRRVRRQDELIDVCPSCYMDPDGMDRTDSWS